MKDYKSVRDEIFRRAEVKKQNRRQKIVRGATVCLLLCLCLPVSLWAWQTGASLEEPPIYAPDNNAPGAPVFGENEEQIQSAAPDASAEPEVEASEEPPMEEEPIYSEEPWEEEPAPAPEEPEVPEGPGEPAEPEEPAPSLPQGVTVELYWYENPNWGNDEILGFIGLKIDGEFDLEKGYIFLTQKGGMLIEQASGGTPLLKSLCEEAGIPFPTHSLTAEAGKLLLEELLDYYS
ncbi:MAG: hypothetical protein J6S15_00425 [Clostridia bacterium]|nr:hypothetical protein [Clostridia bacterium]